MPDKSTMKRVARDRRKGKSASTQAGEFVREEIHHIRKGKHGARSAKQAIAIGLSKARRAGVALPAPRKAARAVRRKVRADSAAGAARGRKPSSASARGRATLGALKRESGAAASHRALARHARSAPRQRRRAERSAAARKAARTKGPAGRSAAAKKAARTRANHRPV